jgi:hypothetical protein
MDLHQEHTLLVPLPTDFLYIHTAVEEVVEVELMLLVVEVLQVDLVDMLILMFL